MGPSLFKVVITKPITIRKATEEDLESLIELARITFKETYPESFSKEDLETIFNPELMLSELSNEDVYYGLVFFEETLAGYAKIEYKTEIAEEENVALLSKLYVLAKFQGARLGSELLRHCFEILSERRIDHLSLLVWNGNPKAIEFYTRKGFIPVKDVSVSFGTKTFVDIKMEAEIPKASATAKIAAGCV